MKHGQGRHAYANGDVYEGGYKAGKKHGYGTYTYASGVVDEGKWKHGKRRRGRRESTEA